MRKLVDAEIFTLMVDLAIGSPRAAVAKVLILHPLNPILADTKKVPYSSQGLEDVLKPDVATHLCVAKIHQCVVEIYLNYQR